MDSCRHFRNHEVNYVPLYDTMFLGTPFRHKILGMHNYANLSPTYVSLTRMK
jgi:hypothetical protein